MKNIENETITYAMLQRFAERAWDEDDRTQLYAMSNAIDRYMIQSLNAEQSAKQAV